MTFRDTIRKPSLRSGWLCRKDKICLVKLQNSDRTPKKASLLYLKARIRSLAEVKTPDQTLVVRPFRLSDRFEFATFG